MSETRRGAEWVPIGFLASRTGVAVSAIRYYESQGLLSSIRNKGGQRRFLRSDIRKISFILIAQQFGFTIERIRDFLEGLPMGRPPTRDDWARIGADLRGELDRRIDTLTALREKLDGCIGCGCLSLEKCALYNPEDRAVRLGSGPRFLVGDTPEKAAET